MVDKILRLSEEFPDEIPQNCYYAKWARSRPGPLKLRVFKAGRPQEDLNKTSTAAAMRFRGTCFIREGP